MFDSASLSSLAEEADDRWDEIERGVGVPLI